MADRNHPEMSSGSPSLQEALDRMARETPPMPESFRASWREAFRQEAAGNPAPFPAGDPPARPAAGEPSGKETESGSNRRKPFPWRRALSTAAIAAFILGGVLLGADRVSLTRNPVPVQDQAAVQSGAPADVTARKQSSLRAGQAPEGRKAAGDIGTDAAVSDEYANAAYEYTDAAYESAGEAEEASYDASGEAAQKASNLTAGAGRGEIAESAAEAAEEAAVPNAASGAMEEAAAVKTAAGATGDTVPVNAASGAMEEAAAVITAVGAAEPEKAPQPTEAPPSPSGSSSPLHTAGILLIVAAFLLAALVLGFPRKGGTGDGSV